MPRWLPSAFPGAALVVVALATTGCAGSSDGGGGAGGDGAGGARTIQVGAPAEISKIGYKVTKVVQKAELGDPAAGGAKARGVFVIVSFELRNERNETYTFAAENTRFVTRDGNRYKASTETGFGLGDRDIFIKDVPPGESVSGDLAFDIPEEKVAGGVLTIEEIEDRGTGRKVKVDLGL